MAFLTQQEIDMAGGDPTARAASGAVVPGNIAFRSAPMGILSDFSTAGTYTWQIRAALAQDADAIQIGFVNGMNAGGTTGSPAISGSVFSISDMSNAPTIGQSPALTFGGAASTPLAAATTTGAPSTTRRKKVTWSDWMPVSTIPRTDGGTLPLVLVRCLVTVASGAPLTILGGTLSPFSNTGGWATKADGRIWDQRFRGGDFSASSVNGFTSGSSVATQTPIGFIRYRARGRVVTVATVGDSIQEGFGSTLFGEGCIYPAVAALSSKTGLALEYCNLAQSGSNYFEIQSMIIDMIANGLAPDIVVLPSGTPNGTPNDGQPWDAGIIRAERQMLAANLAALKGAGIRPIVLTWTPANYSAKAWGASDAIRIAYNETVKGFAASGIPVVDAAGPLTGPVDGNGQQTMVAGTNSDGLHPNDAGYALIIPKTQAAIKSLLPLPSQVY